VASQIALPRLPVAVPAGRHAPTTIVRGPLELQGDRVCAPHALVPEELGEKVREQKQVEPEVLEVEQIGLARVVPDQLPNAGQRIHLDPIWLLARQLARLNLTLRDPLRNHCRPDRQAQ
jgi:hypothetical protein